MKSKKWSPIKIRAEDDADLQVFSQCLYEAIVLPSEVYFNREKKQFAMAIERFTWEISEGKDYLLRQVLSVLIINGVKKINIKDITKKNTIKNILSISNIDNNILILLNNEEIINLKVEKWSCILEDIGKPIFPAITPSHLKNE
jgi:hypothetical protein